MLIPVPEATEANITTIGKRFDDEELDEGFEEAATTGDLDLVDFLVPVTAGDFFFPVDTEEVDALVVLPVVEELEEASILDAPVMDDEEELEELPAGREE